MMQGVKISWVGRSFALAGASDSSRRHKGGRRKTKDERRIMIELFVKKFKASNKGEFPTITVTHKEVGGTFYTVREIWQEIKQKDKSDESLGTDSKCKETEKNETSRDAIQPLSLPEESYMPVSSASAEDNNCSLDLKQARYQEPVSGQQKIMIDQTQEKQEFNILETTLVKNAASNVMGIQPLQELTKGKFISSASNGVCNRSHSLELKEEKHQETLSDAEKQENAIHTEVTETSCPNNQTQTKLEINTVERELGKSAKSDVNGLPSLQNITNGQSIGFVESNHSFQYQEGLSDTSKKKIDIQSNLTETFSRNDQTKEQEDIKNVEMPQGTSATSVVVDLQPLQKLESISISNGVVDKKKILELKEVNYQESLSDTEDLKVIIHKDFMETGCSNNQIQANEETEVVETTLGTGAGSILMGLQRQQEVTCGACFEKDVQNELKNYILHENKNDENMHEPAILFQISETETVADRSMMEPCNSSMKILNKPEIAEVKEQELNLSNEMSSPSSIPLHDDGYVGDIQSSNKLDTRSLEKQNSPGSGEELQHALHMPSDNGSMFFVQKVTTLDALADNSSHVASYDAYKKHLALDSSKAPSSTSDSHSTISIKESLMNLSYSSNHEEENVLLINSTKEMIEESTASYDVVSSSKTDLSTAQEKCTGIPDKDLEGQILSRPHISADQTLSGAKVDAADAFQKGPDELQSKNVEKSSSKYYLELPGNRETLSLEACPHQQGESERVENTRRSTENNSDENSVSILENSDGTYSNSKSLQDSKKAETNIIGDIFMKIFDAVLYLLKK